MRSRGLGKAIWRIWVREERLNLQVFTQMRKVFQSKTQVLKQNVRKRLKIFENIRKRLKIFEKVCEIFENIRKYSTFLARFFCVGFSATNLFNRGERGGRGESFRQDQQGFQDKD